MPFESAARIKRSIHVARAKVGNLARHATKRSRARVHEKLVEPALHHHKRPDPPVSQFNLRPEQSMQHVDVRVLNHNRTAGPGRAFPESLVEVVRHLPFQLHMGKHAPSHARSNPQIIVVPLLHPEVIRKHSRSYTISTLPPASLPT